MHYLDTHRFDHLSEDEVVHRIGDLLAIAVGRFEEQERLKTTPTPMIKAGMPSTASKHVEPVQLLSDPWECRVVEHLQRVGTATPRELAAVLGLTRRTISRKLARLCSAGLCQSEGRTRMACYRLRTDFSQN